MVELRSVVCVSVGMSTEDRAWLTPACTPAHKQGPKTHIQTSGLTSASAFFPSASAACCALSSALCPASSSFRAAASLLDAAASARRRASCVVVLEGKRGCVC